MVVNFQEALVNHFDHGQVHPQLAIKGDAEHFKGFTVRLGVGHDVHGLRRGVKRDLVRSTPLVQLGLALLGLGKMESALALCSNSLKPFKSSA